jgi:predicted transcriptional regulator
MARKLPRLAEGELELLEMLWRTGGATLAEAHQALERPVGYTTVQTRLNRLVDKKLVRRSRSRPARYEAAVSRDAVIATDLGTLSSRVSEGRVVPLVAHLIRDRDLEPDEIEELKQLIRQAEERNRKR